MPGKGIGIVRLQLSRNTATDYMVINNETGIERTAENGFAHCLGMVQMLGILGFECQSGKVQHTHEAAVAKLNSLVIDMPVIGQPVPCALLVLAPRCWPFPRHCQSSSRRIAVTAPAFPVFNPGRARDLRNPQIEKAWLAQAGEITDDMHDNRHQQRPETSGHQKGLGRDHAVQHKKAVGNAPEHLRARERREHRRPAERHALTRTRRRLDAGNDRDRSEKDE